MSEIVDQLGPNSLVLFNESFAATNEREGPRSPGRSCGRYGTASGSCSSRTCTTWRTAWSGRRPPCSSGPRHDDGRRPFRLAVSEPLPTSYGKDLYDRIGGWPPRPPGP